MLQTGVKALPFSLALMALCRRLVVVDGGLGERPRPTRHQPLQAKSSAAARNNSYVALSKTEHLFVVQPI